VNPFTVELAPESWEKRVCNPIDAQQIAADAPSDSARFQLTGRPTCNYSQPEVVKIGSFKFWRTTGVIYRRSGSSDVQAQPEDLEALVAQYAL
jgi:hypothetical protein